MKAHEFNIEAEKIASNYVRERNELNSEVAKVALSKKLNAEQTKRLIEETNKKVMLALFEKTGEQSFPLADFEAVKLVAKPIEKVAFEPQEPMPFAAYFQEKVASEENPKYSDGFIDLWNEMMTKTAEYAQRYEAQLDLYNQIRKTYGSNLSDTPLFKVAALNNDERLPKFKEMVVTLEKTASEMAVLSGKFVDHSEYSAFNDAIVAENFIEKNAAGGFVSNMLYGNLNPLSKAVTSQGAWHTAKTVAALPMNLVGFGLGKTVKGVAVGGGAVLSGGAKMAMKMAPAALAVLPGRSLLDKVFMTGQLKHEAGKMLSSASHTTGTNLVGSAVEGGMMKMSHEEKYATSKNLLNVGSHFVPLGDTMEKNADWHMGLQHLLDFVAPAATGGWGGIATTAAKKLGGGIALTMNSRQLQKSFDTIMQRNPEFKEKEHAIREYFHVIADNAPSLAKNPMVAESIVKNFDSLGTVDFNTIGAMRKTESEGSHSGGDHFTPIRL